MPRQTRACEACGHKIFMALGPNGKHIPLDARPVEAHLYLVRDGGNKAFKSDAPKVYISHFLTCTDPKRFSKGGP